MTTENEQRDSEGRETGRGWVEESSSGGPAWWIVTTRELADLWIGGKAMVLIILFSLLMGVVSFLVATNSELQLIPPNEALFLMMQLTIAVGLFIGLTIGADSISGERERSTLEGLLLTPTSRRQIVVGKFLGAMSPWPAALVVSSVYLALLSPGTNILAATMFWGFLLGTLLVATFTGLGVLVSVWSSSNRTSLSISLFVYILFLIPTQFPGTAQAGGVGQFIKWIDPIEAVNQFLQKILVNNATLEEMTVWLVIPIAAGIFIMGSLFGYAAPRVRLEPGTLTSNLPLLGRIAGVMVAAILLAGPLGARPTMASQTDLMVGERRVEISVDLDHKIVRTGDEFDFNTVVTYHGTGSAPPMTVAMNIVNLERNGAPVDPEDWSPLRAQSVSLEGAGDSATQNWTIYSILPGDYLVYIIAVPRPDSPETTTHPVASQGIHLTVTPYTRINPGGVLPFVIGTPVVLGVGAYFLYRRRRRRIDMGES